MTSNIPSKEVIEELRKQYKPVSWGFEPVKTNRRKSPETPANTR
jgi:hypothetical protein